MDPTRNRMTTSIATTSATASNDLALSVERARDLLAKAVQVDEVKKLRDQAAAMRAYLRQQKAGLAAEQDAAAIVMLAQRRLGELTRAMETAAPEHAPGRRGSNRAANTKEKQLQAFGISTQAASVFEKFARIPPDAFDARIAQVRAMGQRLTTTAVLKTVHVTHNSGNNEWGSPSRYVEGARRVMGSIDLDRASNDGAQKIVQAAHYFTKETNGLRRMRDMPEVARYAGARPLNEWSNPPYENELIITFVECILRDYYDGATEQVCLLVNNATECPWAQWLLAAAKAILFPRGRIAYLDDEGKPQGKPLQGQLLIYLGSDNGAKRFAKEFSEEGVCFLLPGASSKEVLGMIDRAKEQRSRPKAKRTAEPPSDGAKVVEIHPAPRDPSAAAPKPKPAKAAAPKKPLRPKPKPAKAAAPKKKPKPAKAAAPKKKPKPAKKGKG